MKAICVMFILFFASNVILGQKKNSEAIEDFITKNIDTFLLEKNISREELIVEFEQILIDNNFSSTEDISSGYIAFYNYQINPFNNNLQINQIDLKDFPNLKKFRSCNFEILTEFLNIGKLTDEYLSLEESNYVVKTLEYLDHLKASGNIQPINFDLATLKEKGKLSNFAKLFLIFTFNSYSNYDFLLMGEKTFASAFVEKAPQTMIKNSKILGRYWIKVHSKYLKHSQPYELKVKTLDKKGNKITITSKDYITVCLVIDKNGKVHSIYSEEDNSNNLCLIARKFFKNKHANWQPAINNGKAVICSTIEQLCFYE